MPHKEKISTIVNNPNYPILAIADKTGRVYMYNVSYSYDFH